MITKDEFVKLVIDQQKWDKRIDEVSNVFNCYMFEADWVTRACDLFDFILKNSFTYQGVDTIYWWMYEKPDNDLKMYDAQNNELPTETLDDIWEIVKEYLK